MPSFPWKRPSLCLLALLLVSFAFWLALPRILGLAAERWLAIPGVESLRVDIDEIGAGQARLREVRAVYRSLGGHQVSASMHGIALTYSPAERQIQKLNITRANVEVTPADSTEESPWPHLAWPRLPIDDVRINDLRMAMRRPDASLLEARGHLQIRLTEKRLSAEFKTANGLVRLTAAPTEAPEEMLEVLTEWRPKKAPQANVTLRIGREPIRQPATLSGRIPLTTLTGLSNHLGLDLPIDLSDGMLSLRTEAALGSAAGTLTKLSGEAELTDVHGRLTQTSAPLDFSLAGKLRFSWQPPSAQIELQPGWQWRIDAGEKIPLQATGRLNSVFALSYSEDGLLGQGIFPFVLHAKPWGDWEGSVQRILLEQDKGSEEKKLDAAETQLRIKGGAKQLQLDAFQARNAQVAGNAVLHWSRRNGIRAELAAQLTADRLAWHGNKPMNAGPTTWKLDAEATAKTDENFWKTLELKGNASTPQLRIESGGRQTLTLGPSRLQLTRFRPAERNGKPAQKNATGELLLSTNAVRLGSWPAPALRTRVRLNDGSLHGNGALYLRDAEVLHFTGSHALSAGCGEATLSAKQPLPVLDKLLQPRPSHLLPLVLASGEMDARFALNWCAKATATADAKGTFHLRDATLGWDRALADNIQGALQLDGLNPLRGRISFTAQGGQLATGTALTDMKVDLALGDQSLTVHALHAGLLGGTVHGGPLALNWPLTGQPLPLEIRSIDLGQLLALPNVHGLSGKGQLNGVLPLVYRAGGLEIPEGRLTSPGAGTINYAPSAVIPDNPGLQALRNFHFRDLDVTLHYGADGAYRLQNTLEGNNPDFYGGYPIRFRLDINGALPGLFRAALFSGDFNRHILEQLRSGTLE
jgi:hypothetical protein